MFLTVCCCSVKENRKYVLHDIFLGLVIDRKFKKQLYTNFIVNFLFESDASEIYEFNKQYWFTFEHYTSKSELCIQIFFEVL